MFTINCACLAGCILLQLDTTSLGQTPTADARALYQRAASAIAENDTHAAITPLEELTRAFADSELSAIALPHLVECYLIAKRPADALDTVDQNQLNNEHLCALAVLACRSLPEDHAAADRINGHLANCAADPQLASHCREIGCLLSRRYEKLHDYRSAIACLERSSDDSRNIEIDFRLPLAWAHHERMQEHAARSIELLKSIAQNGLNTEQATAVQFELAEAFLANDQVAEALQQMEELSKLVTLQTQGDTVLPAWVGSVHLRRAELCVMMRRYKDAVAIIEDVRASLGDFPKLHEFDFLSARCAIADINFKKAIEHLVAVERTPSADSNAIARAVWMQGEVHFLQRNYTPALEAYKRAVEMRGCEQWQARSLVQAGKCYELLQQPLNALVAYERLLSDCSPEDYPWSNSICDEAAERIAAIKATRNEIR